MIDKVYTGKVETKEFGGWCNPTIHVDNIDMNYVIDADLIELNGRKVKITIEILECSVCGTETDGDDYCKDCAMNMASLREDF